MFLNFLKIAIIFVFCFFFHKNWLYQICTKPMLLLPVKDALRDSAALVSAHRYIFFLLPSQPQLWVGEQFLLEKWLSLLGLWKEETARVPYCFRL